MRDKNILLKIIKSHTKLTDVLNSSGDIQFDFPATLMLFLMMMVSFSYTMFYTLINSGIISFFLSCSLFLYIGLRIVKGEIKASLFYRKLKDEIKIVENEKEFFLVLINEMDRIKIKKNLRKIIKYSIKNNLYETMVRALSDKKIDYDDILGEITKNKKFFISSIESMTNLSALKFYFATDTQKSIGTHLDKKSIFDIKKTVMIPLIKECEKYEMFEYAEEIYQLLDEIESYYWSNRQVLRAEKIITLKRKIKVEKVENSKSIQDNSIKNSVLNNINSKFVREPEQEVGF